MKGHVSRWTQLVAVVLLGVLGPMSCVKTLSQRERSELAARFRFTQSPLPEVPSAAYKTIRTVQPSLRRIAAWISAVGAAAALHDLDRDGLANDICYVETRSDQVIVAPVPGTGQRYAPFTLGHEGVPYDNTMAPMGCLPGDVNDDGLADLVVYFYGRTPLIYLRNPGGSMSSAAYATSELTGSGERWFTNAATFADLDGDGHLDLYFGNYFPDGSRTLDPNASGSAILHDTKSKSFNGGKDHLFLGRSGTTNEASASWFEEVSDFVDDRLSRQWSLAVGAADLDGDLLPELYVANDFGPDQLLHNVTTVRGQPRFAPLYGKGSFATPNSYVMGQDSFKGMGLDFGDLNGDAIFDMFVSNIAEPFAFQESHFVWLSTGNISAMSRGEAPYLQASERLGLSQSGWGWDGRIADFDNDGVPEVVQATGYIKGTVNRWPELQALATGNDQLMSNPEFWPRFQDGADLSGHDANFFFVRASDGRYYDLAAEVGVDDRSVTRGIPVCDCDGDGDLDFIYANQWGPSFYYRNDSPLTNAQGSATPKQAFLGLHVLLAPGSVTDGLPRVRPGHPGADTVGRDAVGAVITVLLPDGRQMISQVDGGTGHSGKRCPDVNFGLGATPAGTNIPVKIRWRDRKGVVRDLGFQLPPGWHTILLEGGK